MADKAIGELTRAASLDDDSLLIAEQQGSAVAVAGSLLKQFVVDAASAQVGAAEQYAKDAADSAQEAQDAVSRIGTAVEDTKENAEAAVKAREAIENMNVEGTTVSPDTPASVEKQVTDGAVTLIFNIPRGVQGEQGVPGPQGPNGDTGDSGVYIGPAPAPDWARVWINPDENPTSTEEWEFEMENGTTETKTVVVL